MSYLPRFLKFSGYETTDIQENHTDGIITIHLKRNDSKSFDCHKCGTALVRRRGQHRLKLQHMPIFDFAVFIKVWRVKGDCPKCKKARSEEMDLVAKETPHMTKDFSWWLGKLCEFSPVSRAADFYETGKMSAWRADFKRMKIMLKYYKIPKVNAISVDEVYARRTGPKGESRNKRFFTVITDLKTRKVIWVSESRDKVALDQFFEIIGEKACKKIKVVSMDQHESYRISVKQYCKNAKVVWDRFHLMQNFNEAVNDERKKIFQYASPGSRGLYQGKYRFIFVKKDSKRTESEKQHIKDAMEGNHLYLQLELIKERFHTFFDAASVEEAQYIFDEVGEWINQSCFFELQRWWENLEKEWDTLSNYFEFRVTTAVSEGINNVIKTLKRRAYGYRNMEYFRLKIMQLCGYLNSQFIPNINYLYEV